MITINQNGKVLEYQTEQFVVMSDLSAKAVRVAKQNAVRNGYPGIKVVQSDAYEHIEDTDFSVAKRFIQGGYRHLVSGGRMIMVVKRLLWYRNKLTSVFGGVKVRECNGYYVLIAEKREGNHRLEKTSPDDFSPRGARFSSR